MIDWDEVQAAFSEGFCHQCHGRLREITSEEQPAADRWAAKPVAVCSRCFCVFSVSRHPDDPWSDIDGIVAYGWNSTNPSDPFHLLEVRPNWRE